MDTVHSCVRTSSQEAFPAAVRSRGKTRCLGRHVQVISCCFSRYLHVFLVLFSLVLLVVFRDLTVAFVFPSTEAGDKLKPEVFRHALGNRCDSLA